MADTLDVLTLAEGKDAVGVAASDSTVDTELARTITSVSRRLDRLCGPIVQRTVTDELHNGGHDSILLTWWPVLSFTTVSERTDPTQAYAALTVDTDYRRTPARGLAGGYGPLLYRVSNGSVTRWASGYDAAKITYQAGRYASTAAVDEVFKDAAQLTMSVWWQQRRPSFGFTAGEFAEPQATYPRFAIPNAAVQLLDGEARRRRSFA